MSNLTPELIENYVYSLYTQSTEKLREMRDEAERMLIPIVTKDTERLLSTLCVALKPEKILEIGTAIGYSAICFAKAAPGASVITIENRERSVHKARANIREMGFEDRIEVRLGKAEDVLPEIEGLFDIVFVDAAKGQYMNFFRLFEKNLKPGTLIISDNVLYKGMPCDDSYVDQRRNKTIAKRMREYLSFLSEDERFETCLLPVGDGVALSYVRYTGENE